MQLPQASSPGSATRTGHPTGTRVEHAAHECDRVGATRAYVHIGAEIA